MTSHLTSQISDDIRFAWQAQYLVRLAGDFSWQAPHFVTFWEITGTRNVVFYNTKSSPSWDESGLRSGGCEMTILWSDIVGYRRMCSDYRRIVFLLAEAFREFPLKSWASRFRGRRSIWWGWRVPCLAKRIGNDVSYVTQIIEDIHFAWQAQYLVMLEGDFTCSTHWKWRFICDADQWWHSFCVAGAVFGDVGGWFYLLDALEMTFHMWRRSVMTFILRGRRSIWWCWRVPLLAPRIGNDVSYVTQISDDIHFAWQAQYLVMLEGDFTCSTHWKWRFICDADQWWHSFCVAGALIGDVGGWLYLLHALEMTFQRSTGAVRCSTL